MSEGEHRRPVPFAPSLRRLPVRWLGPTALVGVIAVATVAVPPLIAPPQRPRAAAPVVPASQPPATTPAVSSVPVASAQPSATVRATARPTSSPRPLKPRIPVTAAPTATAVPATSPRSTPRPTAGKAEPARCATLEEAADIVEVSSAVPSCTAYGTALGTGWSLAGSGTKVMPGERVPGSEEVAVRVETEQQAASVSLLANAAVGVPAPGHVRFRVYGGRTYGTVLRLTVSSSTAARPARPVVLVAARDRWTTFSVKLSALVPAGAGVRRLDLAIATDLVPRAYRFFLADVALVP